MNSRTAALLYIYVSLLDVLVFVGIVILSIEYINPNSKNKVNTIVIRFLYGHIFCLLYLDLPKCACNGQFKVNRDKSIS